MYLIPEKIYSKLNECIDTQMENELFDLNQVINPEKSVISSPNPENNSKESVRNILKENESSTIRNTSNQNSDLLNIPSASVHVNNNTIGNLENSIDDFQTPNKQNSKFMSPNQGQIDSTISNFLEGEILSSTPTNEEKGSSNLSQSLYNDNNTTPKIKKHKIKDKSTRKEVKDLKLNTSNGSNASKKFFQKISPTSKSERTTRKGNTMKLQCIFCTKYYLNIDTFKLHLQKLHTPGSVCVICSKKIESQSNFLKHWEKHYPEIQLGTGKRTKKMRGKNDNKKKKKEKKFAYYPEWNY